MIDRRRFLASVPALALAATPASSFVAPYQRRRRVDSFGVQLYTVRQQMGDDPDRTLEAIAEIGYTEVELFALHGMTPREFRAKLDALGLTAVSSHQSMEDVRNRWDEVLDGAQELGQSLIIVPGIPTENQTTDGLIRVADEFNRAGEAARNAGIRFGYHNHDWEFEPLDDGTIPIDLLLDATDPRLVDWQMDIFWTVNGGADPEARLVRRSGRVTSVHVKDRTASGEMVDVGDGVIDFPSILDLAESRGLLYAFVEHDNPADPMESIRRSFEYLSREHPPASPDGAPRDSFDERVA